MNDRMSGLESGLRMISKRIMVHGNMEEASSMVWQFGSKHFGGR